VDFVDSHCHLDDSKFEIDREAMIARARAAGLKYLLSIGTGDGPPDLEAAVRVADRYSFVYATVGVHPNDVSKINPNTFENLTGLLWHPRVVAVGEIGLDYHWDTPREIQTPAFIRQMEIAAEAKMPIVIHTRDAWQDTLGLLRKHWAPTGLGCLMHCFTGDAEQAQECLDLGFHLAFGGVTTYPKAPEVRAAARIAPPGRLLLETDSPYLPPVPFRGQRNEPAYVIHTAKAVAEIRDVPLEQLARETTANFERFFRIAGPPKNVVESQPSGAIH
jgi:TatD DNase family protein